MTDVYRFSAGESPLLVSVPHDGRAIPDDIAATITDAGRAIPDTDWHVAQLYDFVRELDASLIVANFSRYVVDLNRPADDSALYPGQLSTGLCPEHTFDGAAIYEPGVSIDVELRTEQYWRPYHDKIATTLAAMREAHGYALLWDAHSIPSRVPLLFDGELPELNIGTWDGRSCDAARSDAIAAVAKASGYGWVVNGRFRGGYITRHYGDPGRGVHAMQLEIAQRAYMDESSLAFTESKASQLRDTLRAMMSAFTMPS